jgi:hypothetical protein
MLKEISDSEDVLEVTDEYTGSIGGFGPSHEHLDHTHAHDYYLSQEQLERQRSPIEKSATEQAIFQGFSNHKPIVYALAVLCCITESSVSMV